MPNEPPRRCLQPGDLLLRKVSPGQWHTSPYHVDPVAFEPREDGLSVFFAAFSSPYAILNFFARFRAVWKQVGLRQMPTVRQMIGAGYRVAEVDARVLMDLGVVFEQRRLGWDWERNGHVNALGCDLFIHDIAEASRLLSAEECLSRQGQQVW